MTAEHWDGYRAALDALHDARRAVVTAQEGGARQRRERRGRLEALDARLGDQAARLTDLAGRLRAPLDPAAFTPLPVPPLPWAESSADAAARADAAEGALAEAVRVGRLPQLLPGLRSALARAAVVYVAFALPNGVLSMMLTKASGDRVWLWFLVVWPLVTAVGGSIVIGRTSEPRLPPEGSEQVLARLRPLRHHPWLGVLIALASWWVPAWLIDNVI